MRLSHPLLLPLLVLGAASCGVGRSDEPAVPGGTAGSAAPAEAAQFPLAPGLRGIDSRGGAFSLAALRGEAVLLIFYRGDGCPLCRERLAALDAHRQAYARAGARVIALTPDPPAVAQRTAQTLGLHMPVISVDQATLERWGLWPASERAPRPAAVVVDRDGRIRFRHLGRTAADRAGDIQLLAVFERMRAALAAARRR